MAQIRSKMPTFLIIGAAVALVFIFISFSGQGSQSTVSSGSTSPDLSKGWSVGLANAPVKIIEYADFECPACKAADPIIRNILQQYQGKVYYSYRHFPLGQHKNALAASETAEAAGAAGKFFEMDTLLYSTQDEWANLNNPIDKFKELAGSLGIDSGTVENAIKNKVYETKIIGDRTDGEKLNVDSTPSFFVNGTLYTGVMQEKEWQKIIDTELVKKSSSS